MEISDEFAKEKKQESSNENVVPGNWMLVQCTNLIPVY